MIAKGLATAELVECLVLDLQPVSRVTIAGRLAVGLTVGISVAAAMLILIVGVRPDLGQMLRSVTFWWKGGYLLLTAIISLIIVGQFARPGASVKVLWSLALPPLIYLPAAVWEFSFSVSPSRASVFPSYGWDSCTWFVLILSVPIYVAFWWAFRSFAPTRLAAAGGTIGLCSSAIAGVIYCFHCPADSCLLAVTWATLAFAVATALGSLSARWILHW